MRLKLKIGALMRDKNMRVSELAKAAGITEKTARDLMRGVQTRVDLPILERVATALGVRPLELFEEEDDSRGNSRRATSQAVSIGW